MFEKVGIWKSGVKNRKSRGMKKPREAVAQEYIHFNDEAYECKQFYKTVCDHYQAGGMKHLEHFICLHVPNERSGPTSIASLKKLKDMGMQVGFMDYLILWGKDGKNYQGGIEYKRNATGKHPQSITLEQRVKMLKPEQKNWRQYCLENGIPHEIALTAREGIDHLISWGVIRV